LSSRSNKPPENGNLPVPKHIAIIMDGNGRWARRRFMPRVAGHRKGVEMVRAVVRGVLNGVSGI
jgi:undecaprenyl diphosphate synthase